jgi:uncharacterized protein
MMAKHKPSKIWIDADACPKAVKEMVFKASCRLKIDVTLVANAYQFTPDNALIRLVVVGKGEDVADQYIIDHVEAHDLVVTADIPLAAKVVEKKAVGINPRGEIYKKENVGGILSMRNFMKELRDEGTMTSGPPPFGRKDIQQFANSLNKLLS